MLNGKIGLEIHTYLVTKEKLFCDCIASRERGLQANINICPICTGQPGAKPMLPNQDAIKKAIAIGLMLGCQINKGLRWQRKHYSWPDLPKGYQNTLSGAHAIPIGENGKFFDISISSMHLEDPASWNPETGEVDYNRSGLPLVEIITLPDFKNAGQVIEWLKKLLHNLAYLKAVDTNAGIKVDVNVSILGKTERVEIKNINSLESIEKAIEYELKRQDKEGGKSRETRRYDDKKGKTIVMRTKEQAEDYRFIADPDLQDIILDDSLINNIKKSLPDSPGAKLEKMITKYKIDKKNAEILAKNVDLVEFFEKVAEKIDANFALSWTTIELLRLLNANRKKLDEIDINVEHFIALLELVKSGKITILKGKEILKQFYPKSFMPTSEEGKITDEEELEKVINKVISENLKAVGDYNAGDQQALNFLMGAVMKETKKRADFSIAKKLLIKHISG